MEWSRLDLGVGVIALGSLDQLWSGIEELVDVVRRLESGGTDLEASLALWERGEHLAQVCQGWLDGARARLEAAVGKDAED